MTLCFQEPQRCGRSQLTGQDPGVSSSKAGGLSQSDSQGSDVVRVGGVDKACAVTGGLRRAAEDGFPTGAPLLASRRGSPCCFRSCPGSGRPGAGTEKLGLLDFGLWVSEIIGVFKVGGIPGVEEKDDSSVFQLFHHCLESMSCKWQIVLLYYLLFSAT